MIPRENWKTVFKNSPRLKQRIKNMKGDFPGGSVSKTPCSQGRGATDRGTRSCMHAAAKSLHATIKNQHSLNK